MVRLFAFALLSVGCASAGTPEPRVVERVVYVEAPCEAPVIVEQHGHHASSHDGWHDGSYRDESRHDAEKKPRVQSKHHAKKNHPGHARGDHRSKVAKGSRCDDKPTAEARDRCHRKAARRSNGSHSAFGF